MLDFIIPTILVECLWALYNKRSGDLDHGILLGSIKVIQSTV